jgi:hypothetical protein
VYRSAPPPPPRVVHEFSPARNVIDIEPETSEELRVVAVPPAPEAAAPARSAHPWIEAGAHLMAFPVTVAVIAVVAPMMWMFGPRSHK